MGRQFVRDRVPGMFSVHVPVFWDDADDYEFTFEQLVEFLKQIDRTVEVGPLYGWVCVDGKIRTDEA